MGIGMGLKLVPNVESLPVNNLMDIAGMARKFADDVEAGRYGEVERVIVIADCGDGMHQFGWGESVSMYEALGILEAAKIVSYQSNFEE